MAFVILVLYIAALQLIAAGRFRPLGFPFKFKKGLSILIETAAIFLGFFSNQRTALELPGDARPSGDPV